MHAGATEELDTLLHNGIYVLTCTGTDIRFDVIKTSSVLLMLILILIKCYPVPPVSRHGNRHSHRMVRVHYGLHTGTVPILILVLVNIRVLYLQEKKSSF